MTSSFFCASPCTLSAPASPARPARAPLPTWLAITLTAVATALSNPENSPVGSLSRFSCSFSMVKRVSVLRAVPTGSAPELASSTAAISRPAGAPAGRACPGAVGRQRGLGFGFPGRVAAPGMQRVADQCPAEGVGQPPRRPAPGGGVDGGQVRAGPLVALASGQEGDAGNIGGHDRPEHAEGAPSDLVRLRARPAAVRL